jgi:recombinational DNA repair ATPase RecF
MRSLYTNFVDRTRDTRSKLVSALNEKKDMLRSGKIDEKKLAELDDQIVKLRSDVFRDRLKLVRDRLALLTSDQTRRLAHLKEKMVCHAASKKVHHASAKG